MNFYTLHYVVSGTGFFQTNGKVYHPKKDDCFVIRPDELYYYKADTNDPWHYVWIGFITDVPLPKILNKDVFHEPRLRRVFLSLEDNYYMEYDVEEFVYGKMFEILAILNRQTSDRHPYKSCDIIAQKAKSYIDSNYMNKITVQQLANLMHLERTYFSAAFKKSEGISPQRYLHKLRLLYASKLLTDSEYIMGQIADLCGYNDAFSFSRTFKKHFGVSPNEYVRKHRNLK